jgi:nicotinamide-nucleotide amidase
MIVEIIAVGTELLLGDIVNTNAQYLAKRLADMGFFCYKQTVVGDNPVRLKNAIRNAFDDADMIITTGGLGPTEDDLTKEIAAEYFQLPLQYDSGSWEHIVRRFSGRKLPIPNSNRKQAFFPSGSLILPNANGTAPGAIFGDTKKTIAVLPGPPKEMIPMFESSVVPFLSTKQDGVIVSRVLRTVGIGESAVEERLLPMIDRQSNPTIATYASSNEVTVRITARAASLSEANSLLAETVGEVCSLLGDRVYGSDEQSLEKTVIEHLLAINKTIALVEHATAGLCFASLSEIDGADRVLKRGWTLVDVNTLPSGAAQAEFTAPDGEDLGRRLAVFARKETSADIGLSVIKNASEEAILTITSDKKVMENKYCYTGKTRPVRERLLRQVLDCLRTWE